MEPVIKEGNEVLVSSVPFFFFKPKVGDIVAFKKFDRVFIKRIRNIKDDEYFLKGDNDKDSLDSKKVGWISGINILGKVLIY